MGKYQQEHYKYLLVFLIMMIDVSKKVTVGRAVKNVIHIAGGTATRTVINTCRRTRHVSAIRREATAVAAVAKIITVITAALKNHIPFLFQPNEQCSKRDDKNQMKTESKATSQGKYQDAYN